MLTQEQIQSVVESWNHLRREHAAMNTLHTGSHSHTITSGDGTIYLTPPNPYERQSKANDALTLSDAHRLLKTLQDETQSRAVHAECEDVMARLSKIVEG